MGCPFTSECVASIFRRHPGCDRPPIERSPERLLCEQRFASFCATAARFRANTAMFHVRAVLFASGPAAFTRLNARAHLSTGQLEVGAREARDDSSGGEADIRAIVAIANAIDHLRHILRQTGVRARIACLSAGIASRDAFDIHGMIRRGIYRMCFEHFFDVAHGVISPFFDFAGLLKRSLLAHAVVFLAHDFSRGFALLGHNYSIPRI